MVLPRHTSVYVHFPWCARKCRYCDVATKGVHPSSIPQAAYADAILRELEDRSPALEGRRLSSIFFGGGTPSLFEPRELGRVLAGIRRAFASEVEDLEITTECNPSSFDRAKAEAFRAAGVNRVSLGVQSLSDERLRFLGRLHDARGALAAIADATAVFERVSGDLMFGMPGQDAAALADEIARLLDTGLRHVSAYALTIEPDTVFGDLQRRGKLRVAKEDDYAVMFHEAESLFARYGLSHYEVSNYAVPGEESRHNLHYWRGGAYLGLGAAAVGCLDEGPGRARRWRNLPDGDAYIVAPAEEREESEERLDAETIVREALMLGLRTAEGVDLEDVARRAGIDPLEGRRGTLERRIAQGDVVHEGGRLRVPRERWLHLDGIVADLF